MKKIAIALSVLAGIVFLSGCAYDDNGYNNRYAYDYGYYGARHHYYYRGDARYDCLYDFNAAFCR